MRAVSLELIGPEKAVNSPTRKAYDMATSGSSFDDFYCCSYSLSFAEFEHVLFSILSHATATLVSRFCSRKKS